MRIKLLFFLVSICFLKQVKLYSQQLDIEYVKSYITTKQGLSHNYVTSILSDDLNIKWIGTENGITKFNGFDFTYIKPNEIYEGLKNENIEALFLDKNYNLWIGTKSGGLSFFNLKTNHIEQVNNLLENNDEADLRITSICEDEKGNIWVGTWKNGVFVISPKEKKLVQKFNYFQPIYNIKKDFKNNIWFGSGTRLFQFIADKSELVSYNFKYVISDMIADESRNKIWISTTGMDPNLYYYSYESNTIDSIKAEVPSNFTKKLSIDSFDRIWVGTWRNGLYRSNKELSKFNKIELVTDDSGKLPGNYTTILDIHHDKNNITWLTTAGGGVVKLIESNGFNNLSATHKNPTLKTYLNCTSIFKHENKLFIGTNLKGLFLKKDNDEFKQVEKLENLKINELYKYQNKLYIGNAEGFAVYNLTSDKIEFENRNIKKVTSIYVSKDTLFLGTQQNGIFKIQLNQIHNFTKYENYLEEAEGKFNIESSRISSIKKDEYENIWVGSYNGLHLYSHKTGRFKHQNNFLNKDLPSVIINAMVLSNGFLWAATPSGLLQFENKKTELSLFNIFSQKDGLNNDFICALTYDNQSNIWFSTLTEIVKYNPFKSSLTNYSELNGISSTSFNNNSVFNYNGDQIYFGGVDNVTYFNPEKVKTLNTNPEIIFTNLRINNELIQYNKGSKILKKSFNYVDNISLDYTQSFFSIGFFVNDFYGNLNINYRYRLKGFQKDWIYLQNRNEINFAGLNPKKYQLEIEASRDNINWSKPKKLVIFLAGSPWKSTTAIIIYVIIIGSIILYLVKLNNARIKLKNNLEIARIDKIKEAELTEAKINFFTNISHEFRTPLTLIVSPLKELLERQDLPIDIFNRLNYIQRNTNRLLHLINQLLDFRKADNGLLKLDVSEGNFVRFANEVFLYFSEVAQNNKINYTFSSQIPEIEFPFDRNKMEIVLCNLLSNAIKYTTKGDYIKVHIDADEDFCTITIKDSGVGMKPKEAAKIFDRFYQIKSANTAKMIGSGIGLAFSKKIVELHHGTISVESKIDHGSTFTIKLARDKKLYKANINKNFLKSDDIKAYDKLENTSEIENLNISSKKQTILIVDDNVEILNYLKDILLQDYNVIEASNGEEGLEKATEEIPDIIISDVMMPVKDGLTMSKEIRSQLTTSHIPIILLTARTSTVFEIEGLKTGANDYVTKPFDAKVIKARIESLLENREKLRSYLLNKVRFEPSKEEVEEGNDKENAFIQKAIAIVEKNIENVEFDIETLVNELHMSRSSLFRKIKSLTGLSISAFIRSIRLKNAAHLILTTDLNLNQIAFEVGFNDYKYFKNSFKKQFNCLPSKYAERYKNQVPNS